MRIISKHHDFYDCAAKTLRDNSVTFVRKTEEIVCNPFLKTMGQMDEYEESYYSGQAHSYRFESQLIFFCGTVYPIVINRTGSYWDSHNEHHEEEWNYSYTYSEAKEKNPKLFQDYLKKWFEGGKFFPAHLLVLDRYTRTTEQMRRHLKYLQKVQPSFVVKNDLLTQYAIKNGIAYFSLEFRDMASNIVHYPNLKDKEFFKVISPNDAFSRIQMYLTNELAQERQMPIKPISDKLKAESHGFDKWSFRKESVKVR
jgi:hypothetical protein